MKAQIDACYTSNGCPVPAPKKDGKGEKKAGKGDAGSVEGSGSGSGAGRKQCREAVHKQAEQQILACVKQANPGVTLPANVGKEGGEHGHEHGHGGPHGKGGEKKHGNSSFATCPDKQKQAAVFQCLRKLRNSSAPSEAEKEQQFNAACQAKKTCQAQLTAQCQQQLQAVKKSFCQCDQQLDQPAQQAQLRSGIPACQGVQQPTPKPEGQGQQRKAKSCDEVKPDYCQLGYQQFKADQDKRKAEFKAEHKAKGAANQAN